LDKNPPLETQTKNSSEPPHSVLIKIFTANDQWILISFACLYLATLVTEILPQIQRMEVESEDHLITLLIFLLPLFYLVTRPSMRGRRELHPISLDANSMRCPAKIGSRRYIRIPYEQINAIDSRGSGKGAFHVIRSKDRSVHFPVICFENKAEWQRLMDALTTKISQLPNGSERIGLFMHQNRLAHTIFSKLPRFIIGLLCVIGSVFLLQATNDNTSLHTLAGIGANSELLLKNGEYFRLFSSSFLHAGILHFMLNFLGLLSLGYLVEGCLGPLRTAIIYCFAVLAGTLASGFGGAILSVGSSAGIFGLLAAFGVINLRFYSVLPAGVSMSQRWWIIITAVNLIMPVIIPKIDQAAHVGGLLAGGLLTWLMLRGEELGFTPKTLKKWELRSLYLITTLLVLALIQSAPYWIEPEKRQAANLLVSQRYIAQKNNTSAGLEIFARDIYNQKTPEPLYFPLAEKAIQRAIKIEPDDLSLVETLAELRFAQGQKEEAFQILHAQLRLSVDRSGNQRFLIKKILGLFGEVQTHDIKIFNLDSPQINKDSAVFKINPENFPSGAAILVVVMESHKAHSLLSLKLGKDSKLPIEAKSYKDCIAGLQNPKFIALASITKKQIVPRDKAGDRCYLAHQEKY
jgi:membrane associated rhomboid family serine protease